MLRFCGKGLVEQNEGLHIEIGEQHLIFDKNIWQTAKDYFKHYGDYGNAKMHLVPIYDAEETLICYGWQDYEANRELRMLKELNQEQNVLQFGDIFPDRKEVVVSGCNELAYSFVKYLEGLHIPVSVKGKYWEYLGYQSIGEIDFDDGRILVIQAERVLEHIRGLFPKVIRSASPEFECIDKIYETNILEGRIRDAKGEGLEWLLKKIENKAVIILGIDEKALDIYDLLYECGTDIKYFTIDDIYENQSGWMLGKKVATISEAFQEGEDAVFICACGKNSTWGNQFVELFDYYGYERNDRFFLFHDYADAACSNLIHVLKGKNVFLIGDERLCGILSDYLERIEQGNIKLHYAGTFPQEEFMDEDIVCTVYLWYGQYALDRKSKVFGEGFAAKQYTDYFSNIRTFVSIEKYMRRGADGYQEKQLTPKGILINVTYNYSGNFFFKGIMDGHPDILLLPYNEFSTNIFAYCVRLAVEQPQKILSILYELLKIEMKENEFLIAFPYWNGFERSMKRWLSLREKFTSQELFVIFHIAYMEMMGSENIMDVSQKIIYFDPHWTPPEKRSFLAEWLESEKINGQIITIFRDSAARLGSMYARGKEKGKIRSACHMVEWMADHTLEGIGLEKAISRYYQRFEVRFEDLKLHPGEELMKVCGRMEIPWTDSMMHTTAFGKTSSMGTIRDFDLKPVFHKHEKDWSEFDRFRLYLITSPYQKKCGYPYEDSTTFSRTELQEIFLKEFQFQSKVQFESTEDQAAYYLWAHELIRWKLWDNRKQMVMDDTGPVFAPIEIGKSETELKLEEMKLIKENRNHWVDFIGHKEKIVLYGLGKDGAALIDCLDASVWPRLVLCDKKAQGETYVFRGKQVISPLELCGRYQDYDILITSSRFYGPIRAELDDLGICAGRIQCNTVQIWDGQESANKS